MTGLMPNVDCLANFSRLSRLSFSLTPIQGNFPPIGSLKSLEELSFAHSRLSGTLPSSIGMASKLRVLSLQGNLLSGTLPESISKLTALSLLHLFENQFFGSVPKLSSSVVNCKLQDSFSIEGVRDQNCFSNCTVKNELILLNILF